MPYVNGARVTNQEWTDRFGSIKQLHTGPGGENPADAPEVDPEVGAPKPVKTSKGAGGKRSKRSSASAKAAIADALGVTGDSPVLADIDVSGIDAADATDEEAK